MAFINYDEVRKRLAGQEPPPSTPPPPANAPRPPATPPPSGGRAGLPGDWTQTLLRVGGLSGMPTAPQGQQVAPSSAPMPLPARRIVDSVHDVDYQTVQRGLQQRGLPTQELPFEHIPENVPHVSGRGQRTTVHVEQRTPMKGANVPLPPQLKPSKPETTRRYVQERPYPQVEEQERPGEYGFLRGTKEFAAERWREAQQAVNEAGKGKYEAVFHTTDAVTGEGIKGGGVMAALHNIGQWNPGGVEVGKAATALWESVSLLGLPAEITERGIGQALSEPYRQEFGVGEDPVKEQALQAALGVAYSGPEAIRAAYNDALRLAMQGQLDASNAIEVQARNGVWWKEALGQLVLDPLNLLSGSGKAVQQTENIRQARKLFEVPVLADNLPVHTDEIARGLRNIATRKGQIREAEGLVDAGAALINPRFTNSIVNRQVERSQQIIDTMTGQLERKIGARLQVKGLAKGTDEFQIALESELGDALEDVAQVWMGLASDDIRDVEAAGMVLKRMGYGDVPMSLMGRRTAYLMKELTGGDQLTKALKAGPTREAVSDAWAKAAARTLEQVIKQPKWERGAVQTAAKAVLKAEEPANRFFGNLFMGMSLGFPVRNFSDNTAKMTAIGHSPFRYAVRKALGKVKHIEEAYGYHVVGSERGVGAQGLGKSTKGIMKYLTPGLALSEKGEQYSSRLLSRSAHIDALHRLWPQARKGVEFPADAPAELVRHIDDAIRHAVYYGPDDLDNVLTQLKQAAKGAEAVPPAVGDVPPTAKAPLILQDAWRRPVSVITDAMQARNDALYPAVMDVLKNAADEREALAQLRQIQAAMLEHIEAVADNAGAFGPAVGTMAGDIARQMVRKPNYSVATVEELAQNISNLEHQLAVSKGRAMTAAVRSVRDTDWIEYIDRVEGEFNQALEGVVSYQVTEYARYLAGEITEADYAHNVNIAFAKARYTLDRRYSQVIGESGAAWEAPKLGTIEEETRHLLTKYLNRAAYRNQYYGLAGESKGIEDVATQVHTMYRDGTAVPDVHFNRKLRLISGRTEPVKNLNDLSDDEMLTAINWFRENQGLGPVTLQDLYNKELNLEVVFPDTPITRKVEAEPVKTAFKRATPKDIENFKFMYNMSDEGIIYQPIREAIAPDWAPAYDLGDYPPMNALNFKRKGGRVMVSRGSSHMPSDNIISGAVDEAGELRLTTMSSDVKTVQKYADDMLNSGMPGDTPVQIPDAVVEDFALALDTDVEGLTLRQLSTLNDPQGAAWFVDDAGVTHYVFSEQFRGEITRDNYLEWLSGNLEELGKTADEDTKLAVQTARMAAEGQLPRGPSPSHMDAAMTGNTEGLKLIEGIMDWVEDAAKIPPAEIPAEAIDIKGWETAIGEIKSRYFQTHVLASEVARRTRDFALLDYRDRRYFDPLIKMIYPWAYWHSRSVPRWLESLAANPSLVAHYTNFQRELREWNDKDPTIPEWAKDQIVIHPPGYPGQMFLNYQSNFNAVGQIFETFDDPDQQKGAVGKAISNLNMAGPAPHPLLIAAYAGQRWLAGDEPGLRSYGYLAGVTRGFASLTGKTLEPWLWLTDPKTKKRIPWTGGSKWDLAKAGRWTGIRAREGAITQEEAVLATATKSGKVYRDSLNQILTNYRRPSVFGSLLFGVQLSPRQDWEYDLSVLGAEWGAATEADDNEAKRRILDENPYLGAVWMAYDNETERNIKLTKDVLSRLPPGYETAELYEQAGIPPQLIDTFYEDYPNGGGMAEWDPYDYEQFNRGIMNLAEILGIPDVQTASEWRQAKANRKALYEQLEGLYPGIQETQGTYFSILENQGKDAANEYAASTQLYDYWRDLNTAMVQDPYLLKYYASPSKVDSAAKTLAHDEYERRWPGIHKTNEEYWAIPEDDKISRREFRAKHPEWRAYQKQKDEILQQVRNNLVQERQDAGMGSTEELRTLDYIVKGRPNAAQKATLEKISELGLKAEMPPPPPAPKAKNYTEEEQAVWEHNDQIYTGLLGRYPEAFNWQREYERLTEVQGKDAANLYAEQVGLFDYWDEVKLAKAADPIILVTMEQDDIESVAKAVMYRHAYERWPELEATLDEYYKYPKRSDQRKKILSDNPWLREYWDWKNGAQQYYIAHLLAQQTQARSKGGQ